MKQLIDYGDGLTATLIRTDISPKCPIETKRLQDMTMVLGRIIVNDKKDYKVRLLLNNFTSSLSLYKMVKKTNEYVKLLMKEEKFTSNDITQSFFVFYESFDTKSIDITNKIKFE